jgi:glycosyltransferase involved in cell wall biosynthesis
MKIAYVTSYDATDVKQWSGLGYHIAGALRGAGLDLDEVGPLTTASSRLLMFKKLAYRGLGGRRHMINREPSVARGYASQITQRLDRFADVVFSPGSIPVSCLECRQPIAFWTDATFAGVLNFYDVFSHLSAETIRNGNRLEKAALDKCRLVIYSSEWAARTAVEHYAIDAGKVAVVPFGANIDVDFGADEIGALIDSRPTTSCNLLFLGVDWERKGGPVACEVARLLNEAGLPTTLTVVGCQPKLSADHAAFVHVVGPLSKASPAGRERLHSLLAASHFLILPSRADCTPVVFSEANAFAVPCLTSGVGGIPSIVIEGLNGHRFSLENEAAAYAACVDRLMGAYSDYRQLAINSYAQYRDRLNWGVAGAAVRRLLEERCS